VEVESRSPVARTRAWLVRWGPLLPILVAEFIVLLGFGALIPVLPLYVQGQGIDATTLGLIIAGWPIAKLISEPVFGWIADRRHRRPQMLIGLVVLAVATILPLFFTSALALFLLRFVAGVGAGMYDPAARGMIVDGTKEDERGEAFGFYAAFQMGGFILGPMIGAVAAGLGGGYGFPFLLTGVLTFLAAAVLFVALPRAPRTVHHEGGPTPQAMPRPAAQAPLSALLNRTLVSALVMHFGFQLAFGVYSVVWTLFMLHLGASFAWAAFTFVIFGVPAMIMSPIAGRMVDRRGPLPFVVLGGVFIILSGAVYALSWEPVLPSLVIPVEAVAEAFLVPALFAMVAIGTPAGRSATAQGIFGGVGTIALIVASASAGALWDMEPTLPFWFFVLGASVSLVLGLVIARGATGLRRELRGAGAGGSGAGGIGAGEIGAGEIGAGESGAGESGTRILPPERELAPAPER
jgi:MFS transporter, DHA1 family, multidrug resistance protein